MKTLFTLRLNKHLKITELIDKNNEKQETTNYFVIPYVPSIANQIKNFVKNTNRTCVQEFKSTNQVHQNKDIVSKNEQKNVVYCIECSSCDANYIGQTKQQLNTRIKEHLNHIRKRHEKTSVVAEHSINTGHNFKCKK